MTFNDRPIDISLFLFTVQIFLTICSLTLLTKMQIILEVRNKFFEKMLKYVFENFWATKNSRIMQKNCSISLPLTSIRWISSTISSLCPLLSAEPSINLISFKFSSEKHLKNCDSNLGLRMGNKYAIHCAL